jgi:hypothetical protein
MAGKDGSALKPPFESGSGRVGWFYQPKEKRKMDGAGSRGNLNMN